MHQIIITQEEKQRELGYEICMFRETCKELFSGTRRSQFWRNLLVESFALHMRVLIDFFYSDERKYDDDIVAQDLLPDDVRWKELRPPLIKLLKEAKTKADKQLAHLSCNRIILEKEGRKGWKILEISNEINKIINFFEEIKKQKSFKSSS
ncbi:hypothetical protein HQ544_00660 [Candidatus Falkowbacteria bacterium]|nr:hypothetical protein [Candidatus Falkowbacteria bacterium]